MREKWWVRSVFECEKWMDALATSGKGRGWFEECVSECVNEESIYALSENRCDEQGVFQFEGIYVRTYWYFKIGKDANEQSKEMGIQTN